MSSYEELKQIIKNQQDKRDKEFLDKMNSRDKKRFKSTEDLNNFVDTLLDNGTKRSEEELRKNIINIKEIEKDGFTFGIVTTKSKYKDYKGLEDLGKKVPTVTWYRTYMLINKDDDMINNIFYKQFKKEEQATAYYNELVEYVQKSEVEEIFSKIKESL